MSVSEDRIHLWFNRDDETVRGAQGFTPLLERLRSSFLPPPTRLRGPSGRERAVDGYLSEPVLKGLDRREGEVMLTNPEHRLHVDLWQIPGGSVVGLFFPVTPQTTADAIRDLFLDLARILAPTYANGHLERLGNQLHREHYAAHPRTFYASGLYWLNLFGPAEQARQGGAALAHNPHAQVRQLSEGLLLEVGTGPLDAATEAGHARLLAATAALPPLPGQAATPEQPDPEQPQAAGSPDVNRAEPPAPAAAAPETASGPPTGHQPAEPDRTPADLVTIAGVLGYLDPADQGFWVSKHLNPGVRMDANTVAKLKALPGQGSPPVSQVHVLFSLREAAELNRPALQAAGVRAWYVDLQTGRPREVGG
jgi:hypothetical protein